MCKTHVHLIGIGGYGMSAIACVLLDLGYRVTGSDISGNMFVKKLRGRGALISCEHSKENIEGADIVVYSSSISPDNVERVAATRQGIPVLHRSLMLARLLNGKKGIAVAGAHGKTTTSSMIAQTLEMCGMDPTYIIGGEVLYLKGNAKAGKSEIVVAEADESDGSFLEYSPYMAVVTNIEADHLENYQGSFTNLKNAYQTFLSQVSPDGYAIVYYEDDHVKDIVANSSNTVITYGFNECADYVARNVFEKGNEVSFELESKGEVYGLIKLKVPGRHNVANAMAAAISCIKLGVPFTKISDALYHFQGTKRRFQVIGEIDNICVIDDYAHHPTEIEATLQGAKNLGRRIIAIFQPQRYSRTHQLMDEFSRAFSLADEVIIHTLYAPEGEEPIGGVNAEILAQRVKENSNANTKFVDKKEDVIEYLLNHTSSNDLVLTMGAGDIWRIAHGFYERLQHKG